MKISNFKFQISGIIIPTVVIIIAALLRLVPHPPNVAPITAMALFGGVYLNKKHALVVPLITLFVSDIFLGFHDTMLFVYGSFLLSGLIGLWIRQRKSFQTLFFASFASSTLFFLITNFGVWLVGNMYPKTLFGLYQAYLYAIPFFRNTILGDILYVGLLFGGFAIVQKTITARFLKTATP